MIGIPLVLLLLFLYQPPGADVSVTMAAAAGALIGGVLGSTTHYRARPMVVGALVGGLPGLVAIYLLAGYEIIIASVAGGMLLIAMVAVGAIFGSLWAGRRDARRHEVALP